MQGRLWRSSDSRVLPDVWIVRIILSSSLVVLTRTNIRSLWAKAEHAPGMIMPSGGLFPPDAVPTPTLELYTQSTASWEARLDTAKQFETMPK
jgi:hypothetical protein